MHDPQLAGAGRGGSILEKLPMNYLYLGAIHRAMPQAKLLLVSRDPLDSCFAMYRTLFGEAYPFSYDFGDLARYYAADARLVAHWRDTPVGAIHEVRYESLVSDPIGTSCAAGRSVGGGRAAVRITNLSQAPVAASLAVVHDAGHVRRGLRRRLPYLVMEFVDGETLCQRLGGHDSMPWQQAVRIAVQVADAVSRMRDSDVQKPPGIAEAIDWLAALDLLGIERLDAAAIDRTLGSVLKYDEDQEVIRAAGLDRLVGSGG